MGLFQNKHADKSGKSPIVEVFENEKNFFDESFREEIKTHARDYFEEVIQKNVVIFKQDLDAAVAEVKADLKTQTSEKLDKAIAEVNADLREHTTRRLDEQFEAYGKEVKAAQTETIESLTRTASGLEDSYKQLSQKLEQSVEGQAAVFAGAAKENSDRIAVMKQSQDAALDLLNKSAQALQEQHQALRTMLQKNIVDQENMILSAFQDNMAHIVEHYLLGAMGDQFDMKAQLPSIIKQMEENKQAIADDMKL